MSQQIEIADLRLERSQKVLRIEKALARTFIKIADEILADKRYPDINSLKVKYNALVYDNTRAALSVISQISTRYVNEKTKTNPYPTDSDIALIKQQTDKTVDSFWRKIMLKIQKPNNDLEFFISTVATVAATGTLALTTRAKLLQIKSKPLGAASLYSSEEDWSPETEPVAIETKKPKLQWKTSHDERVCPICMDLDNQSWDFDDNTIPIPGEQSPQGSHINCRCIINLIMPEDPQYAYL